MVKINLSSVQLELDRLKNNQIQREDLLFTNSGDGGGFKFRSNWKEMHGRLARNAALGASENNRGIIFEG